MVIQYPEYRAIDDISILRGLLPSKPYCSDNLKKEGLLVRPRDTALKKHYIQMNSPHQITFFTIDIDYRVEYAGIAEDYNLPQPIWCVGNLKNGHVHLIYALLSPVYCTSMAHLAPLKYLKAIIDAYCEKLGADPMYSGLISKNPWSPRWCVFQTGNLLYSLECLAGYVDLSRKVTKKTVEEVAGLGRNCHVFENVRVWSYRAIRDFWGKKHGSSEWFDAVKFKCLQENAKFSDPLYDSEIKQIAKSIAHWTWRRSTPEGFSDWQRNNVNRRWTKESKKAQGIEMLKAGSSIDEVMQVLEVSQRTVYNWLKEANPDEVKATLTELKPWEALGISRATWYRQLKL